MTDPEQAALAALVAWREKDATYQAEPTFVAKQADELDAAEAILRDAADLLIAERAAAVGR